MSQQHVVSLDDGPGHDPHVPFIQDSQHPHPRRRRMVHKVLFSHGGPSQGHILVLIVLFLLLYLIALIYHSKPSDEPVNHLRSLLSDLESRTKHFPTESRHVKDPMVHTSGKEIRTTTPHQELSKSAIKKKYHKKMGKKPKSHPTSDSNHVDPHEKVRNDLMGTIYLPVSTHQYLVNTSKCRIPNYDPWDPKIEQYLEEPHRPLDCGVTMVSPLTYQFENNIHYNLALLDDPDYGDLFSQLTCSWYWFDRDETQSAYWRDWTVKRSNHKQWGFNDQTLSTDKDFVSIECKLSEQLAYKSFHPLIRRVHQVKKRTKPIQRENLNEDPFNVIMLGIESTSRNNGIRQFRQTLKVLVDKYNISTMFGYNKVADNTFPNTVPLTTGLNVHELQQYCWQDGDKTFDSCPFIWYQYRNAGYVTYHAEDDGIFNWNARGYNQTPADYYFRPFVLGYEKWMPEKTWYTCWGGHSVAQIMLNHTESFIRSFNDSPFFIWSYDNYPMHDHLNQGSELDGYYAQFLDRISEIPAILDRTFVFVFGDHGMRFGKFRRTYQGMMEDRLPMMFIHIPQKFRERYPELYANLQRNRNMLTTHFDINKTLKHILQLSLKPGKELSDGQVDPQTLPPVNDHYAYYFWGLPKPHNDYSVFDAIPEDRTCEMAGINDHWCTCHESVSANTTENQYLVHLVGDVAVQRINQRLEDHIDKCAELKLQSVTDARLRNLTQEIGLEELMFELRIQFMTTPGGGVFEATLRASLTCIHRESWAENECVQLQSDISRLNSYRDQVGCMKDDQVWKYCYCRDLLSKG